MLRGERDISSQAIGSGLARVLIEHYKISKGPIASDGEIIIDNCTFDVTLLTDSTTRAISQILMFTSKTIPEKYFEQGHFYPEFRGTPLALTSHTVDLQKKIALVTLASAALPLCDAHCAVIQEAVTAILSGEMEEMDEEF